MPATLHENAQQMSANYRMAFDMHRPTRSMGGALARRAASAARHFSGGREIRHELRER